MSNRRNGRTCKPVLQMKLDGWFTRYQDNIDSSIFASTFAYFQISSMQKVVIVTGCSAGGIGAHLYVPALYTPATTLTYHSS